MVSPRTPYGFQLVTDKRTFNMCAVSHASVRAWLNAFQNRPLDYVSKKKKKKPLKLKEPLASEVIAEGSGVIEGFGDDTDSESDDEGDFAIHLDSDTSVTASSPVPEAAAPDPPAAPAAPVSPKETNAASGGGAAANDEFSFATNPLMRKKLGRQSSQSTVPSSSTLVTNRTSEKIETRARSRTATPAQLATAVVDAKPYSSAPLSSVLVEGTGGAVSDFTSAFDVALSEAADSAASDVASAMSGQQRRPS